MRSPKVFAITIITTSFIAGFLTGHLEDAHAAKPQQGLKVGDSAPDFESRTYDGGTVKLSTLLAKGPVVLVFYRGSWCPFCNLHLKAFQRKLEAFDAAGASIVAISVDPPQVGAQTVEKNSLGFEVVSDPDAAILKAYRVVASAKRANKEISMPATYVVDPSGKITFAFVSENPMSRSKPEEVLKALRPPASVSG